MPPAEQSNLTRININHSSSVRGLFTCSRAHPLPRQFAIPQRSRSCHPSVLPSHRVRANGRLQRITTEIFNFRTFQPWNTRARTFAGIISNRLIPSAISSPSVSRQHRRVYNFLSSNGQHTLPHAAVQTRWNCRL